jgi:lipopolysaccharide transport system permease protein
MLTSVIRNIRQYRYFIVQQSRVLLINDFKKSFLGSVWLFITPIVTVIVWVLLHYAGIIHPGKIQMSYPAFVLIGSTLWSLFLEMYLAAGRIIQAYGKLMIVKSFPVEALIVSLFLVQIIRFSVLLTITILALLLLNTPLSWYLILVPVYLIPLAVFGFSLGLFTSILRVVASDITNMLDMGIKLLMFLTPIIYSPKINHSWLSNLVSYNPLTYLIGYPRDMFTGFFTTSQSIFLLCTTVSFIMLYLGTRHVVKNSSYTLERLITT